jgi:hypothetical protein
MPKPVVKINISLERNKISQSFPWSFHSNLMCLFHDLEKCGVQNKNVRWPSDGDIEGHNTNCN